MPDHPSTDAAGLLDRLASSIRDSIGAGVVFGPPVAGDGVTVIPVARARFGFGGGGGPPSDGRAEGAGGGGGGSTHPVGFIEVRGDRVRFRRFSNPVAFVGAVIVLVLAAALLTRVLCRGGRCHRDGCGRENDVRAPSGKPGTSP